MLLRKCVRNQHHPVTKVLLILQHILFLKDSIILTQLFFFCNKMCLFLKDSIILTQPRYFLMQHRPLYQSPRPSSASSVAVAASSERRSEPHQLEAPAAGAVPGGDVFVAPADAASPDATAPPPTARRAGEEGEGGRYVDNMYVCMYVCMYLRMYVCMYVCMYACICICIHTRMYISLSLCVYTRTLYPYTNTTKIHTCLHFPPPNLNLTTPTQPTHTYPPSQVVKKTSAEAPRRAPETMMM